MNSISNAFSDLILGNPFATPVGTLIEEATEDFVGDEMWRLFPGVYQAINQSVTGPKDAIRAIRRRFCESVQSTDIIAYNSLILLEACSLNCGYRFLVALATRDNLRDFSRFVGKDATLVSDRTRQKLLSLFQTWAFKYGNQIDLREFANIYGELRSQGIRFSDAAEDSAQPTSIPLTSEASALSAVCHAPPAIREHRPRVPLEPVSIGKSKWTTDLAQVRVNICVLSDLVTDAESSTPDHEAKLLMAQIAESLRHMSQRLAQAVSAWEAYQENLPNRGTSDAILLDMLNVSDELHTVLLRYKRVMQPTVPAGNSTDAAPVPANDPPPAVPEHGSFIGEQQPLAIPASSTSYSVGGDEATVNLESPSTETKSGSKDDDSLIDL